MTRARVKALHDKVNSLLSMLVLDSTLDGMLPHADMLCVLRYIPQEDSLMDQDDKLKRCTQGEGGEEAARKQSVPDPVDRLPDRPPRPQPALTPTSNRPSRSSIRCTGSHTDLAGYLNRELTEPRSSTDPGWNPVVDPVQTGPPGLQPGLGPV